MLDPYSDSIIDIKNDAMSLFQLTNNILLGIKIELLTLNTKFMFNFDNFDNEKIMFLKLIQKEELNYNELMHYNIHEFKLMYNFYKLIKSKHKNLFKHVNIDNIFIYNKSSIRLNSAKINGNFYMHI